MNIISLIASNNYLVVNKTLLRQLGAEAAIMLSELASEYSLWLQSGKLTDDGFFYSTVEKIQEATTLTDWKQRTAIELLKKNGIIDVTLKGLPAKRHIKINEIRLVEFLKENEDSHGTSSAKIAELDAEKSQNLSAKIAELDAEKFGTSYYLNINNTELVNNNLNSCSHSECVNEKPKSEKVFEHDHYAYKAATFLDKKIKENFPNVKDKTEKDLQRWAVDFDYCNRIDGHEWELMSDVLKYSQWDAFWRKNILSGKKFREQFDRLLADMTEAERSGKY